jgi:hypothetical protein
LSARVSKLREAIELWKSGRLDEAEVACRAVLAADPDEVNGVQLFADIALARGNAHAAARRSGSLFDTAGYCRHLEAAFVEIHARHLRGEAPSALDVGALMARGAI